MTERDRLMMAQQLIDRLLYLEGEDKDSFINYLGTLYEAYPIPRKIIYYPNEESNLSDAD